MRSLFLLLLTILLASPVLANGKKIDYQIDDQTYEGFYVTRSPKAPLVLLIHDWDGLTDYEVRRAGMLAAKGYAVFAADLFGKGVRPTAVEDKRQHTGELYKDREKMRRLLQGALATAKELGAKTDNAVAAGYCFGGAAVLELARSGAELKGFASFHGGLATPDGQDYRQTKAPILVMHGSADGHITLDDFVTLAIDLEQQGVAHELTTYSGAPHAFTVYDTPRYHEEADRKSWRRFLEFLEEQLR